MGDKAKAPAEVTTKGKRVVLKMDAGEFETMLDSARKWADLVKTDELTQDAEAMTYFHARSLVYQQLQADYDKARKKA
jgi:hypothetical protein